MGIFHRSHHSVALPLTAAFLTFVLVFIPLDAAPTLQDTCNIFCRAGQASVLHYDSGEYIYDFESEITTKVSLTNPESRQTKVKAEVVITANSACDLVLTVKSLSVSDARGNNLAQIPNVQETSARFTLQDGLVGSVCVDKDEPTYTANIKRAIISLLQNKALSGVSDGSVVESDVSGRCPTSYVLSGDNYVKTKELNACTHREGGFSILHGVPYEIVSKHNSVPDLKSVQSCEQSLENGIYKTVKCTEHHSVVASRSEESKLIRTTVVTTLKLKSSDKQAKKLTPQNLVKSSIFFDYADEHTNQEEEASARNARELVERICDNIRPDGISSEVPVLHLDLKNIITYVNKEHLTQIYNDVKSGSLCAGHTIKAKKLLLDAAAMSGSDGGIGLLSDLYLKGELDKVTKRYFYLYTTFAARPHEESLTAVLPLLSATGDNFSKRSILAVSGLAHQFCKVTHPDCLNFHEYTDIVNRIAQIVQSNLANDAQSDVVIAALQGLGNLEHLTESAVAAINSALHSTNDRIRVRALDAFRRDPCQHTLKVEAQTIFSTKKNPSNVRISAYLANLRCLQPEDAKVIQHVLDDEESFQVGGFVQSNLETLANSNSPSTRQLQSAARQLHLNLKYPQQLRRFSRHLGTSFFNSDVNLGFSAEGNVIFSKESFIPRQVSANLTVDLFGQSYNFLEVGAYLENFDSLQENLFGPHGKFPIHKDLSPKALYNAVFKRLSRAKRELPGPVTLHREGLAPLNQQVQIPDHRSEPARADVYVRIYGTTLGIVSINTDKVQDVANEVRSQVRGILQNTIRSSSRDVEVINPILFMDDEIIVPTTSGLGLASTFEGSTIPSMDYHKTLQTPDETHPFDLKVKLSTNVATSIKLRHSIVGGPIENGLQFEANVRSGGAIDISLHSESKRFEAKLNLPNEKVRAFDVSTNVYWIERTPGKSEVKNDFKPSVHVIPGDESCQILPSFVAKAVGLKICGSSTVNLRNGIEGVFEGKQYLSASLEKTEPSMQGYAIVFTKDTEGNNRKYELTLDTPGATTNRKVSVTALAENDDHGKRKIEVEVHTPIKGGSAKFEYERTYSDAVKGIQAKLTLPSAVLGVQGEIKTSSTGPNEITYKPLLKLEYPGGKSGATKKTTLLTGKVIRNVGQSIAFDLSTQLPEKSFSISPLDIFVRGKVLANRQSETEYDYELKGIQVGARDRGQEGEPSPVLILDGTYKRHGNQQDTDLTGKYGLDLEHQLTYHKSLLREPGHFKLDTKVASTRVPFLNFEVDAEARRDPSAGKYDSHYKLTYGAATSPRWTLSSESNVVVQSAKHFDVQNKLNFNFPVREGELYNVSLLTHVKNFVGEEQLVDLQLLKTNGQVTVHFDRKAANNNDFKLEVKVDTPKAKGSLLQTRETINDNTAKDYTSSYKYETILVSQSLGIERENFVAFVRLLNKGNKRGISISAKNTVSSGVNIPELTLDLALKASPDKYNGNLDFKAGGEQMASLDVNILKKQSTTQPQVLLKSFLKNQWRIDLTRKTPSENQVITKLHAELLRTGRTVTLDVNRRREADVRKLEADLKWDAARDPTKSISVRSVTKITQGSIIIDSKNDITVVGQHVKVNVGATIPTDIRHGEHSVSITFVDTAEKSHTLNYKNNLGIEPNLRKSKAEITITCPEMPPTEVHWDVQSVNPDLRRLILDITANVDIITNNAKALDLNAHLESKVVDGKNSLGVKLDVSGGSVPDAAHLESNLVFGQKYLSTKNSLKLGSAGSGFEVEGKFEETQTQYRQLDLHFVLNDFPGVKYHKIEGKSSHRRRLDGTLDITRITELILDQSVALKSKYALRLVNDHLTAEADITLRDNHVLDAKLEGTINAQEVDVKGTVVVNDINVKVNTHVNRDDPLQNLAFGVESGAFGVDVKLTRPAPSKYSIHNILKVNGKDLQLDADLTVAANEKGIDLKFARSAGETIAEAKFHVTKSGETRNFDGLASYASRRVSFNGNLNKIAGGYDGKVDIKSTTYGDLVGKFAVALDNNHHRISLVGGQASQPLDIITLDYNRQKTGHTVKAEGTFSSSLPSMVAHIENSEPVTKGTFTTEYTHLEGSANGETGCDLKFSTHFTLDAPVDVSFELKATNLELLAQGNLKHATHHTDTTGTFQLKRPGTTESPRKTIFQVVLRNDADHEVYGIISKTERVVDPVNVEHTTQLILGNEETDVLGVHVYGKGKRGEDRCEGGIDLQLPKRKVSVAYNRHSASSGELSVWLDKVRHPEQRLHVAIEYEPLTTPDGAKGYKYTATVEHPKLVKALVIKRQVVRFGSLIVHDSNTELDIFDDPNNKIVINAKVAWAEAAHQHLKAEVAAKSVGLGLSLEGEGNITNEDDSIVANIHYSLTGPSGQTKSRNVEVVVAAGHQSLLVGDKTNPILLLSRSVRDQGEHRRRRSASDSNDIDVRYEIHLPGMTDTRIIDVHVHASLPPHLDVKTFTTVPGRAFEISLGFPTEKQLVLAAYRQIGAERTGLAELSVALNSTRLLSVKAHWDLEALQEVLRTAIERFDTTHDKLEDVTDAYVDEISKELQQTLQRLSAALPNLTPLQEHLAHELSEIRSEWGQDRPSATVTQFVQIIVLSVEAATEPLRKALEVLANLPQYIRELKERIPALVKRYEKLKKNVTRAVGQALAKIFKALKPVIDQIQALLNKLDVPGRINAAREWRVKARTTLDDLLAKLIEAFLARADVIDRYLQSSNILTPELKDLGTTVLRHVVHRLRGEASDLSEVSDKLRETVKKVVGEFLTVDLSNGVISALIPLPKSVNSLLDVGKAIAKALPSLSKVKVPLPYRNQVTSVLNLLRQFFRDLIQSNILTALNRALRTNAIPNAAQAYIIGSQYFITFDGKLFHHEGHCQYLLLEDFVHKNVTLAIQFHNVNGEIKKSIILSDNDETATINHDFSVTHQGEHIEVIETADTVKIIDDHELTVTCVKSRDVCTVTLDDGYLFGKVAGLLGTYNNEQYDDLRTPAGQPTSTVEEFVASWKLDQCTEDPVPQHPEALPEAQSACASAFSSSWSPLSYGFKYSDPKEFEYICNRLAIENGWSVEEAVCTAAEAYQQTTQGVVYLNQLSSCSH